jgi:hypothetical protein
MLILCQERPLLTLKIKQHKQTLSMDKILSFKAGNQDADKSLARPGRKQARKHVRDARDFNNTEMRAIIKFIFLQGKAPKGIRAILTLTSFLPGRAKDLSAPL